jgi:threonine/homoserine/homoserine lactone efflux protein
MMMASGVNFGLRKSLPHLLGIDIGFPLMLIAVGMGISQLFELVPSLMLWLKILGVIYLSYLALKIATTPIQNTESSKLGPIGKPFTFIQAALFQWINPKAWIMAVGAMATYTTAGSDYLTQVFVIAGLFIIFGAPCTVVWLGFGKALKGFLSHASYQRIFNQCMALLLLASLYPVVDDLLKTLW